MTWAEKTCVICGAKYQPEGGRQRYCRACNPYGKSKKQKPRTCAFCGAEFKPHDQRQKYCGRQCLARAHRPRKPEGTVCTRCLKEFIPKKPGVSLCPDCLVAVNNPEPEDDPIILERGPCRTCRSQETDRYGIMVCPVRGGIRCADANPDHDCRLRVPEERPQEPEESITDTLIRRGKRIIRRGDKEIAALLELREKRKEKKDE